jgi:hypothetical protein
MSLQLIWTIHTLPLWFLVFSLFLPRVALLVYWAGSAMLPFHLHGWVTLAFAVLLPRLLVLYLIYLDQGISLWFVLHAVVALLVWSGSGGYRARRSRHGYAKE